MEFVTFTNFKLTNIGSTQSFSRDPIFSVEPTQSHVRPLTELVTQRIDLKTQDNFTNLLSDTTASSSALCSFQISPELDQNTHKDWVSPKSNKPVTRNKPVFNWYPIGRHFYFASRASYEALLMNECKIALSSSSHSNHVSGF